MIDIKKLAATVIRGEVAVQFPLEYNDFGQEIRDANGHLILQMRGWGRLQYHSDGPDAAAQIQDHLGQWIADTLNAEYAK